MAITLTTIVGFSLLLTWIFILYQPNLGPGSIQKVGWQSWDVVSMDDSQTPVNGSSTDLETTVDPETPGVDWWNVTVPDTPVDSSSFPLDIWAPLLPHTSGLSEIGVTACRIHPAYAEELCAPDSTSEQDAIKGKWVRVKRDLNIEGGYTSPYLSIYYRRTRRQDIELITDIVLLGDNQEPTSPGTWTRVDTSLRYGIYGASPLYLWYRIGNTAGEMTAVERSSIITELDVLYGEDVPWYGFEKLEPPTMPEKGAIQATWITYRRGVKPPPRAPPLHFSRSGKFKIMQVADLHYSVSQGFCRDTDLEPCVHSDNLTNTLVGKALDAEKPDLVVFSGDQLNGQRTTWDGKSVLAKFAKAVTDRGIPWAAVFGNHDEEDGAPKEEQLAMMKTLPYSLVDRGPKDVHGVGNYVLKVYSADPSKTQLLTLYFLDSGSYTKGTWDFFGFNPTEYDWIRESQTNWFLQQSSLINPIERPFTPDSAKDIDHVWKARQEQITPDTRRLAKPNALMFFHIPLPEAYSKADSDPQTHRPLDVGTHGQEAPGNAKNNAGFFVDGVLNAPESEHVGKGNALEVKVIGNGHCHITENCRRVQGVWNCFGGGGFDRRFRIYEISDYGETIRTYKRTEKDEIVDDMILAGKGAAQLKLWIIYNTNVRAVRDTEGNERARYEEVEDMNFRTALNRQQSDSFHCQQEVKVIHRDAIIHQSPQPHQWRAAASEERVLKAKPAVESAVTRLLVSIKQLLESLTQWSNTKIDENAVSDVYVRLGNDFNAAVAAFSGYNIDMSELMTVPDELRNVLEQCLAEDATPENLELYLPTVRRIITDLLTGLRGKQSIYRRLQTRSGDPTNGHERTDSRSSRGERSSKREQGHRSQNSRTLAEAERPDRESVSRKSGQSSSSARRAEFAQASTPSDEDQHVGGFAPPIEQSPRQQRKPYFEEEDTPVPASIESRMKQRYPSTSEAPSPSSSQRSLPSSPAVPPPPIVEPTPPTPKVSPQIVPAVPASVKRYSLVDNPVSPPAVVVEPSSPGQDLDAKPASPAPETPPEMANSLAALKKNDVLERRASKRFSTFNISKMTGAPRERPGRHGTPNRRSFAASSALTPGELAVLTEEGDENAPGPASSPLRREGSTRSRSASRTGTLERRQDAPPVPKLPKAVQNIAPPEPTDKSPEAPSETTGDPSKLTVFLQVGREVKKAVVEPNISFSSLRVLFVDKFSYSPGQDNFPAIYIRDPSSGVQYELEDTDEVKDRCLLSLNIEPLDQIKQHIDAKILGLSAELLELRNVVTTSSARPPMLLPNIVAEPLAESTPLAHRPSDRQFQHVARRLSRFVGDPNSPLHAANFSQIQPQMTGQSLQPQMTGASVLSDYSSRVVTDLKTQFDEVQNLRRDLGIMRQLYTEFMKQTKESLKTLRTQTHSVKQLANTKVGGARGYIDTGKQKLDSRSQNVLTEVERLLDTVESMKDDVTKRQITPKELFVKTIRRDIDNVQKELESLTEHINTIKPMWKKTWEEELQNIVEEQQFLSHQEEFLNDLIEDHKSVIDMYGHIEKVISLRNTGGPNGSIKPRTRGFRPPPPSEGDGLSNVMLEIRGAAVDPEKRMKAIEANQKNRQKELEARSDELHAELQDFVGQKKLRMTGGAEEAERVRQKRSEVTLRAMFNVNAASPPSLSPDLPPSPSY
ncbi:hypothetical protein H0H92_013730 [Tricholoma furcatifolium]|nr:hypothetical protein H0H92_013730 [Tricholoma furcatifolium]